MEIREEEDSFVLYNDQNEIIGEISWEEKNSVLIIDHTFVEPKYGGRGLAHKLVEAIVAKAEDENLQLWPICPYAKKVLNQTPEYQAVLRHKEII